MTVPSADLANLRGLLDVVVHALAAGSAERGGPAPSTTPEELAASWLDLENVPDEGLGADALADIVRRYAAGSVDPADPACVAHLQPPPLPIAVAADVAISALNQSLDSWDQAPAGTSLEPPVIRSLAALVGYDPGVAGGVVTTGGTESMLMGLLLARDRGTDGRRARVLCSAAAHFSVARNAGFLGLGEDSVVVVPTGADHRMDAAGLRAALATVEAGGERPVAVVATAGTTDLGAIDPLREVAAAAREHGAWLHADAAYGGGALFSRALAPLLDGIALADSVGLDLHKVGWLPAASGVFLVRDDAAFAPLARSVAYLNAADDEEAGYPSLLGHSLRTTRRADVVRIAVVLRALGRDGLGARVDRCHALAAYAADRVQAHDDLELYADPVLTTVVFRLRGGDLVNAQVRRALLASGRAVVGRTEIGGAVWLKLTLLNPSTAESDVDAVLDAVREAGRSS
ncbi:MAG: aminotransferase class V-fold PLP-dependent enzyme [Streptosporangiales bacterium]|nr:aminotransferase class V-fold PLP-dependent enzyme [Streptosporangiales bacterium]